MDSPRRANLPEFCCPASACPPSNAFTGAAIPNQNLPLVVHNRSINADYGTRVQGTACGPNQNNGTCVYSQQPNNAFGDVRPGSLTGPSFQNIDMAVAKTFTVWREQHVDFRWRWSWRQLQRPFVSGAAAHGQPGGTGAGASRPFSITLNSECGAGASLMTCHIMMPPYCFPSCVSCAMVFSPT